MPRKNKPEVETTTITIHREIRDKLEGLKLVDGEYLNSVLRRIIKVYEENTE